MSDPVQCAICGWTGHADDLDDLTGGPVCPACGEPVAGD